MTQTETTDIFDSIRKPEIRICVQCNNEYRYSDTKRTRCKQCLTLYLRQYRADNADRIQNNKLKNRFGITLAQYNAILESQGGVCYLCKLLPDMGKTNLAVDHNHNCCPGKKSCGKCIRGLLCNSCNLILGLLESKVCINDISTNQLILSMVEYRNHPPAQEIISLANNCKDQ